MPGSNAIDLDSPHPLTPEQIRHFRERGYVKLKDVLSPATLLHYGEAITAEEKRLRGFGVTATPNLLINGRVLVPGPADVSTYVQALDQALFPQLPSDKKHLH